MKPRVVLVLAAFALVAPLVAPSSATGRAATRGSITSLPNQGEGSGTFCGGSQQDPSNKKYFVV